MSYILYIILGIGLLMFGLVSSIDAFKGGNETVVSILLMHWGISGLLLLLFGLSHLIGGPAV